MKTYKLHDGEGRLYAFEVANTLIGRSTVAAIAQSIAGAEVIELHRAWWGPDEFCRFRVGGVEFRAWEPFGDNSRYWIGPEPPHACQEVASVLRAFQGYRPIVRRPVVTGVALVVGALVAGLIARGTPGEAALPALALLGMGGLWLLGAPALGWVDNAKRH